VRWPVDESMRRGRRTPGSAAPRKQDQETGTEDDA